MAQGYIAQRQDYWIYSSALSISLNAMGSPNRIQGSVSSGAVIMAFKANVNEDDTLGWNAAHQYKTWPLSCSPTYFNTDTEKYVYVAIPRNEQIGTQAIVVFPSEKLDLYGKNAADEQIGSTDYIYIWLQGKISATDGTTARQWNPLFDPGILDTDEGREEQRNKSEWFEYSFVSETATFLKKIAMSASSWFLNLRLGDSAHNLTGVATSATEDEYIDADFLVATPSYIEHNYLSKKHDDVAEGNITFEQNIDVKQDATIEGDAEVQGDLDVKQDAKIEGVLTALLKILTNKLQSDNYEGDGAFDAGFGLFKHKNDGNHHSYMVVDELFVRIKAIFNELEIRKISFSGGDLVFSHAGGKVVMVRALYDNYDLVTPDLSYMDVERGVFSPYGTYDPETRSIDLSTATLVPAAGAQVIGWRLYFMKDDGTTATRNWWKVDDQARCQTFGVLEPGHYEQTETTYYWRLVMEVGTETLTVKEGEEDEREVTYDYIDLSKADCDAGSTEPKVGDQVVQMGNRTDTERMDFIMLDITSNDSPALKMYNRVSGYSLEGKAESQISRKDTHITAEKFIIRTDYGLFQQPKDRGDWSSITPDDQGHRRCYYYDLVQHNGGTWLCIIAEPNYTTDEPSESSAAWRVYAQKGEKGEKGDSITKKSETYRYATNNTGVRPAPTSQDWQTTKPTLQQGYWLYTETTITWSDNSTTVFYTDERNPNDGIPGQAVTILSQSVTYSKQTAGNLDPTTLTYGTYPSSLSKGDWLYSKTTVTYSDNTHTDSYSVSYIGTDGDTGRGISSVVEEYAVNNDPDNAPAASSFSTTFPTTWGENNRYIWNREVITYTKGNPATETTTPRIKAIWTKDGKGIDSIVNRYLTNNVAIGITKQNYKTYNGGNEWPTTITPTTESNPYLWNFEVISYTDGTSEMTDPHVIGHYGADGGPGDDAINVIVSPASLIVNQNLENPSNLSTLTETFVVQVKKGETSQTVNSITFTAEQDTNNTYKALFLKNGTSTPAGTGTITGDTLTLKKIGQYTESSVNYYFDTAYANLTVNYGNNQTINARINIYANLLGTWSEKVEGSTKTEVARALTYGYDPTSGEVISLETFGQYIKSDQENISTISSKQNNGKNLLGGVLTGTGWKSSTSKSTITSSLHKISLDDNGFFNAATGDTMIIKTSQSVKRGQDYTVSFETPSGEATGTGISWYIRSSSGSGDDLASGVMIPSGMTSRSFTFNIPGTGSLSIRICIGTKILRYPQMETGATATKFEAGGTETSSQILQTADHIQAVIYDDLGETGIDIEGGNIDLKANKTRFLTSAGVPMIAVQMCDANGNVGTGAAYTIPSIVFYNGRIGDTGVTPQWVLNYLGFIAATNAGVRYSFTGVFNILCFQRSISSKVNHSGVDTDYEVSSRGLASQCFLNRFIYETMYLFNSGYYINDSGEKVYQPTNGVNYEMYNNRIDLRRYWLTDEINSIFLPDSTNNAPAKGYYFVESDVTRYNGDWPPSDKWDSITSGGGGSNGGDPVILIKAAKVFDLVYFDETAWAENNPSGVQTVWKNAFVIFYEGSGNTLERVSIGLMVGGNIEMFNSPVFHKGNTEDPCTIQDIIDVYESIS